MIVLTALLAAHTYSSPYIDSRIDVLDFVSICGSMLWTLAGILMYPNLTAQAQNQVGINPVGPSPPDLERNAFRLVVGGAWVKVTRGR